jgi:hypothetical protein
MFDETRFDGALFSLLALFPIGFSAYKQKLKLLPGSWFAIAAIFIGSLPFFFSPQFSVSLASSLSGLSDRAPLFSALILAGCMSQWQRRNLWLTMLPLFVAVALACCFCLPQSLGWDPPGYLNLLGRRPLYPFLGLNHAGEIVMPALLLCIGLGQKYCAKRWLPLAIPMALLCGFWGGNAIRLGLLCGLLALFLVSKIKNKSLIIIAAVFIVGELMRAFTGDGFRSLEAEYRSTEVRFEMYAAGIEKAVDTPLGIGVGQFEHSYPQWRASGEAQMNNANMSNGAFRAPKSMHNDFLQALIELGWLGFALLTAGCYRLYKHIRLNARQDALLYAGFAISFAVCAFTRSPFTDNLPAMAIFFLVVAGLSQSSTKKDVCGKQSLPTLVASYGLCIFALLPVYSNLRGESIMASAIEDATNNVDGEHLFSRLSTISEVRPWDSRNWIMMAAMYMHDGQYNYARTCFDQALLYHPYDMTALLGAIETEEQDPNGSAARLLLHLETAEKLMPYHETVMTLRLKILNPLRDSYKDAYQTLVKRGDGRARNYWVAYEFIEAHIAITKQRPDLARAALLSAAQFSDGNRAIIERAAKKEELSRQLLTQLTLEVFPRWPELD